MKIRSLRKYSHPDLSDHVIHFVGRSWPPNKRVPEDIHKQSERGRLFTGILKTGQILAFPVFGSGPDPVVCFTECTRAGVQTLIRDGRYGPWGVAFTKDFVFQRGGGPAFYVRGDDWKDVDKLPPSLRFRATRFWPGADELKTVAEILHRHSLEPESQWTHEREWRVRGETDPPAFRFRPEDVAFVVVGDWDSANDAYPTVVVDERTGEIDDPDELWIPDRD